MKNAKVTGFKNTLKNKIIPAKQTTDNGLVGKVIEDVLKKQGLPIDSSSRGPDISSDNFDIEIKTHRKGSKADVSIGTVSVDHIAAYDYQSSIIKEKLKTIRWVVYDENSPFVDPNVSVVEKDDVLDFEFDRIQKEIEYQYNSKRQEIITNNKAYNVNTRVGWWEKKTKNSWAFRIPYNKWNGFKTYNKTAAAFNEMFSNEECTNSN